MKLELPNDLVARVQQRVSLDPGSSEADVIRRALDSLDWSDQETQAILEGIDAWKAGDTQKFEEFDREFRAKNGIAQDA